MTEKTYTEKLIESLRKEASDCQCIAAICGSNMKEGFNILGVKMAAAANEIERLNEMPNMLLAQSTQRLQYIHVLEQRIAELEQDQKTILASANRILSRPDIGMTIGAPERKGKA